MLFHRSESARTVMKFMYLKECATGDLIRFRTDDGKTLWAIAGKKDRAFFPIAVLTGDGAPFVVSAVINGHTIDVFDTFPVLNYGKDFELSPDHLVECEIGDGPLLKTKGSFVMADDDRYLVVGQHRQAGIRYFHLASGDVRGEPGGMLASFKTWMLRISGLAPNPSSLKLV